MIQRTLRPIHDKDSYSKLATQQIQYDLYRLLYQPLLEALEGKDLREHSKVSALITAFGSGRITFRDGFVYGPFSAAISRELRALGSKFNKTKKAFKAHLSIFPPDVRAAIAKGATSEKDKVDMARKTARELRSDLIPSIDFAPLATGTLDDLHKQFKKVTPEDLQIPFEMNEGQRKKILEDYTTNMNLSIKGWADEAIERLRFQVEDKVGEGMRAEDLKEVIMAEYGITANRAKFIARQETSLLVAKYRETRYSDAGLNKYQWSTSHDERVREDHRILDGKIFSWDDPPIVDRATGKRANPGEFFRCRCVSLPVFKIAGELVTV